MNVCPSKMQRKDQTKCVQDEGDMKSGVMTVEIMLS